MCDIEYVCIVLISLLNIFNINVNLVKFQCRKNRVCVCHDAFSLSVPQTQLGRDFSYLNMYLDSSSGSEDEPLVLSQVFKVLSAQYPRERFQFL